jgi:hypothetical protein
LLYDLGKKTERKIMGGAGSGNWYRFDKKTTTGECHSLDVRYLHRENLLRSGHSFSLRWSRAGRETGSIGGIVEGTKTPERMILLYHHRKGRAQNGKTCGSPYPSPGRPATSKERPWFLCPGAGCGRRVAVLYGPGRYFLGRHCYDLAYQSQRDTKMYRALHRAQDIRRRLGGSANMLEPFPEKPKGMHWRTYERLWWEHHEAETEQLVGMREWLDMLEKEVVLNPR